VERQSARFLFRAGHAPSQGAPDRAVLEGVIFNLYSILPAVEALIGPTRTMKATGGFARSGLWRQMMADIFNREVVVPESFESSCLGAAVLGLYALGRVDSLNAIAGMVGAMHRHAPMPATWRFTAIAADLSGIPTKLEAEYRAIAAFQRDLVRWLNRPGDAHRRPCNEEKKS
jgi:gluconokinase